MHKPTASLSISINVIMVSFSVPQKETWVVAIGGVTKAAT
jgi:hypothetical protein